MIHVYYTIIDGCEWSRYEGDRLFKNKKELNNFIESIHSRMDDIKINSIEKVK